MKLLILMLLSSALFSSNYDPMEYEKRKVLQKFDLQKSINGFNEYQEPDDRLDMSGFNRLIPVFDPEDDLPQHAGNSLEMEANIQQEIDDELQPYISNSIHKEKLLKIQNDFIKSKSEKGEEVLASDLAFSIADFLGKNGNVEHSVYFYNLAGRSMRSNLEEYLAIGAMLVANYNNIVATSKPNAPNSIIFGLVQKALKYFRISGEEVGQYCADDLVKIRNLMVRWPISPKKIMDDQFYGAGALGAKIYGTKFVDDLINDVRKFNRIFSAFKYVNSTEANGDLFTALADAGFYGVTKFFHNNPQYVWVSPRGYVVRIKMTKENKWQFTVGLTHVNPFFWNKNSPVSEKKRSDLLVKNTEYFSKANEYPDVTTYEYNEIFKIVVDDDLVMIIPAFRNFYWANYAEINPMMEKAHKSLVGVHKRVNTGEKFMGKK